MAEMVETSLGSETRPLLIFSACGGSSLRLGPQLSSLVEIDAFVGRKRIMVCGIFAFVAVSLLTVGRILFKGRVVRSTVAEVSGTTLDMFESFPSSESLGWDGYYFDTCGAVLDTKNQSQKYNGSLCMLKKKLNSKKDCNQYYFGCGLYASSPFALCNLQNGDGYEYTANALLACSTGQKSCYGAAGSCQAPQGKPQFDCCRKSRAPLKPVAKGLSPYSGPSGQQCGSHGRGSTPSDNMFLHFLVLSMKDMPHASTWKSFFRGAPPRSYHVWLHIASSDQRMAFLKRYGSEYGDARQAQLTNLTVVPTVYSEYVDDLLSPMIQMVRFALDYSPATNVHEKFIFISDSTLPLKPFNYIRHELSKYPDSSDFCIHPDLPGFNFDTFHWHENLTSFEKKVVKASQWSILAKMDAKKLVDFQPTPLVSQKITIRLPGGINPKVFDSSQLWCPDEDAIFTSIFGFFNTSKQNMSFPGIGLISDKLPFTRSFQGCCRTLLVHTFSTSVLSHGDLRLLKDLGQTIGHGTDIIVDWHMLLVFKKLSRTAFKLLRDSDYLFARKFPSMTPPEYADVMFEEDSWDRNDRIHKQGKDRKERKDK